MIIGVCGYGFTGSGAIVDVLKEFSELQVLDQVEFKISYMQDGIEDLSYHLVDHPCRYFGSDSAIRRFRLIIREFSKKYQEITKGEFLHLADEFIDSITDVSWRGTCSFHKVESSRFMRYFKYSLMTRVRKGLYKYGKIWVQFPDKEMYLSIAPENFMANSRRFISSIISCMGGNQEKIVLNQPFPADRPEFSFPYFEDPLAICVTRDPRDLYLLAKDYAKPRARFIPNDSVQDFITYYRKIMENATNSQADTERVHRVAFEDLIYDYEHSIAQIMKFLGISNHEDKLKYFLPDISIRNTRLFKKNTRFASDIREIEQSLGPWLYNFPQDSPEIIVGKGRVF